jgi:hypothetical protein
VFSSAVARTPRGASFLARRCNPCAIRRTMPVPYEPTREATQHAAFGGWDAGTTRSGAPSRAALSPGEAASLSAHRLEAPAIRRDCGSTLALRSKMPRAATPTAHAAAQSHPGRDGHDRGAPWARVQFATGLPLPPLIKRGSEDWWARRPCSRRRRAARAPTPGREGLSGRLEVCAASGVVREW